VTTRRLHVPPGRLTGTEVALGGPEHKYLARVLRVRRGDQVILFDGAGVEVDAEVEEVGRHETRLLLGTRRRQTDAPGGAHPITLLTAVPKGGRMDFLIQKATELGVHEIVPVIADRSVVRPELGRQARWHKIAREAARQSGRADVPVVAPPGTLGAAVARRDLPERRLALFEGERGESLAAALADGPGAAPTALLIGPEGGLSATDLEAARAASFRTVGLGPLVLRVETAAIVAVALVQSAHGRLG
jgi:16S rRNA (uracil1498-N3)-methyltransferase